MDSLANISHENLRLSRNKIEVNIPAHDPMIAARQSIAYFLKLFIQDGYLSPNYTELPEIEASEVPPYTVSGIQIFEGAYIPIEAYIDSFLSSTAPDFEQNKITVCEALTTSYYCKAIIKNGATIVSETQLPSSHVIKAGIADSTFRAWENRLFLHPSALAFRFLTQKPNGSLIQPNQPEHLYFITNFSPLPSSLHLRCKLHYANGSSSTKTVMSLSGVAAYAVYCCPVGPIAVGAHSDPLEVDSYEVWLSNQNNERVSEARKYKIDKRYHRNLRYILYENSLGGFDTLPLFGKSSENLKIGREESSRYSPFGAGATFSEVVTNRITGERSLRIATGYISTEQLQYLEDLFFSKQIFIATDRAYLPLVLVSDNIDSHEDDTYKRGRVLLFRYANKQYSYSNLPPAPPEIQRPTEWRPFGTASCLLNVRGIRVGQGQFSQLQKFYIDTNQPVVPIQIKNNVANTEGYLGPVASALCDAATTPFFSVAISRPISFARNDCPSDKGGSTPIVAIEANTYGSEINQEDADSKAETAWALQNNQATANALGLCLVRYYSAALSLQSSYARLGCATGYAGTKPTINIAASAYISLVSQADADAQALSAAHALDTQTYSNEHGSCIVIYYSVAISRLGTYSRNNCPTDYTGTKATITVAAGAYTSLVSQADANAKAVVYAASLDTQATANSQGVCRAIWDYDYNVPVRMWHYRTNDNNIIIEAIGNFSSGNWNIGSPKDYNFAAMEHDDNNFIQLGPMNGPPDYVTTITFKVYRNGLLWFTYVDSNTQNNIMIPIFLITRNFPESGDKIFVDVIIG